MSDYLLEYSTEQKMELLKRKKLHQSGKSKSYTFQEVKQYAVEAFIKSSKIKNY